MDTKSKITPGPWIANFENREGNFTDIEPGIARVFGLGRTPNANALAISAVPDLIAALRVLVDRAEEQHPHFESPRGQFDIITAKAALAKAGV